MTRKKKGNLPYRNIHPSIWTDGDVAELTLLQFKFFILSFSAPEAAASNFGIYEIHSGGLFMYLFGTPSDDTEVWKKQNHDLTATIDFFNKERSNLLEYDRKNHMMFCKNFAKYQSDYLSTWQGYVPKLLHDWGKSKKKVPLFWREFYVKNKLMIIEMNEKAKKDSRNELGVNLDEFISENSTPIGVDHDAAPTLFEL